MNEIWLYKGPEVQNRLIEDTNPAHRTVLVKVRECVDFNFIFVCFTNYSTVIIKTPTAVNAIHTTGPLHIRVGCTWPIM